jgi:hypothetical protein
LTSPSGIDRFITINRVEFLHPEIFCFTPGILAPKGRKMLKNEFRIENPIYSLNGEFKNGIC